MGGGAVVKLASDHLLSGILCGGQSSGTAAWRCDWLRKGEMKTTVNFWPRRRSSAGTPSSGVVEQSPLSSCVYSANPTGTMGRGGGGGGGGNEHREGGEKDTRARGREEGKRENRQSCAAVWKWISAFLPRGTVETCSQTHKRLLKSKVKYKHRLCINMRSFKNIAKSNNNGWHIFILNYLWLCEICLPTASLSVVTEDVCVIRLGSMEADQALELWLPR